MSAGWLECQPGGWSTCGYCVSARWLEYMRLLCVSRVAGVHVVIVCQPGGWCCKGDGLPLYAFFQC